MMSCIVNLVHAMENERKKITNKTEENKERGVSAMGSFRRGNQQLTKMEKT